MKITNEMGLPQPFVRAVESFLEKTRVPGADYSVTELIGPSWIRFLRRKHDAEIEVDVSDMLYMLDGLAMHVVLERAAGDGGRAETSALRRLSMPDGSSVAISGTVDHIVDEMDGPVSDYKVTSAWAVKDGAKDEWVAQLNAYAWLLDAPPEKPLQIVARLRDWNKKAALRNDWPRRGVVRLSVPRWSSEQVVQYLQGRVVAHRAPEPCTAEERWEKPDRVAVMRHGRNRASRLLDSVSEAEEWMSDNGIFDATLEPRPGTKNRCEGNYCHVAEFCDAWGKNR